MSQFDGRQVHRNSLCFFSLSSFPSFCSLSLGLRQVPLVMLGFANTEYGQSKVPLHRIIEVIPALPWMSKSPSVARITLPEFPKCFYFGLSGIGKLLGLLQEPRKGGAFRRGFLQKSTPLLAVALLVPNVLLGPTNTVDTEIRVT